MSSGPIYHRLLLVIARWQFTAWHDIRVEGAEHIPAEGAAIIASNHPTYLDPAFLMVGVKRQIRFMAWERPFRIPILGAMMRAYGAIPVDLKHPGRDSFEGAIKVLRAGEVFGIFPEGGRTKGKYSMNPLKSGVARLALITGAPIIPATIMGGRQVWRRGRLLPRPGPIRVVFHPPVRIEKSARDEWRRDRDAEKRIIEALMATIGKKLGPSMRGEERRARLLRKSAPQTPTPIVEGVPLAYMALLWRYLDAAAFPTVGAASLKWVLAYFFVLGLELALEARGWIIKWFRHLLPWLTLAGIVHTTIEGLPVWAVAFEIIAGFLLLWCTIFRFPLYRRLRAPLLVLSYGTWLLEAVTRAAP